MIETNLNGSCFNFFMPHIHEKIDFCVETYIVYDNKVLLRKHDKHKIWLSVGGHIELDEDPIQAAVREVKEEVGLDVKIVSTRPPTTKSKKNFTPLFPPEFMYRHPIGKTHNHVGLVYFATSNTNKLVLSTTEVADDCKWFTLEELDDESFGIGEDIIIYAKAALEFLKDK